MDRKYSYAVFIMENLSLLRCLAFPFSHSPQPRFPDLCTCRIPRTLSPSNSPLCQPLNGSCHITVNGGACDSFCSANPAVHGRGASEPGALTSAAMLSSTNNPSLIFRPALRFKTSLLNISLQFRASVAS